MAVSQVVYGGRTLVDLTSDTVTTDSLEMGATAHNASGNLITGLARRITVTQEAGESESLVMSQKAVTDLVNDALGDTSASYETVDSVDDMTDTSKSYVLSSTGTIWTYGEVETEGGKRYTNLYDPETMATDEYLNKRINSSAAYVDADGSFSTPFVSVNIKAGETITVRANGNFWYATGGSGRIIPYIGGEGTNLAQTTSGKILGSGRPYSALGWTGEGVVENGIITMVSEPLASDVTRMRFTMCWGSTVTAADVQNVILTVNEEIDDTPNIIIEEKWYDTGLTPSTGGGGGGNYVTLLVDVQKNASNIAELDKRVMALETDADTLTVPSFWQDAVDACIAKIKALQVGRNCITFPFFSDNHQRNGYAGLLIAHIMKECNIPYCMYGGDSISSGTIVDEAEMIEQDKAFDTIMSYVPNGRLCRAVGNHDGYWYDGTNKFYYTRDQVYELFLREESVAQNKHFGEDGTYYYIDDIASKVRFIVLNTNGGSVDATQLAWMQNTALSFNESGWAVVFISHQPISNHYHALISNAAEVRTAVKNYINGSSANKAAVVGWYSGHIHRDRIYTGAATNTTDDAQGTAMGFTQITITSDHTGIAYDDATKHTVAQDDKSHAIDFVTINKATRKVNLTRLGIGNDRSYTY